MDFKCNACGATFHMGPGFQGHAASCTRCHKGVLVPAFRHAGAGPAQGTTASAHGPMKVPHAVHRPRPVEVKTANAGHGPLGFIKRIFGGKGAPAEAPPVEAQPVETETTAAPS